MQEQDLTPFDETSYVRATIDEMESMLEEEILNSEERKER